MNFTEEEEFEFALAAEAEAKSSASTNSNLPVTSPKTQGLFGTSFLADSPLLQKARIPEQAIRGFSGAMMDAIEPETQSVPLNMAMRLPQTLASIGGEFLSDAVSPESVGMAGLGTALPLIGGVAKFAGKGIGGLSGMITGSSGAVTKAAGAGLEGGTAQKALIDAMRGTVSEKQVANDALDSLSAIRKARGKAYTEKLETIYADSFQKKIDLTPIKTELDDLLNSYNIGRSKKGVMDFSRAALDDASAKDVERIANLVDEWGTKSGDDSVKGLDILKRRIDDFYSPSSEARAFVTSLKNTVKKTIVDKVPEYKKLTKGYQEASDLIHDVSSELSLGANAKAGTIMRKLKQALRQNFDLRKEFVETLDKYGNKNLLEQTAGVELNELLPKGLSRLAATGTLGASAFNPSALATLPFYSPRLAGETALKVGQGARMASKLAMPLVRQPIKAGIGLELLRRRLDEE